VQIPRRPARRRVRVKTSQPPVQQAIDGAAMPRTAAVRGISDAELGCTAVSRVPAACNKSHGCRLGRFRYGNGSHACRARFLRIGFPAAFGCPLARRGSAGCQPNSSGAPDRPCGPFFTPPQALRRRAARCRW
jgi:hypothetical protein